MRMTQEKKFINALDLDIFLPYLDMAVFGHPDLYCWRVMLTLSYSSQERLQLFYCKISSHESFLLFWYFLFFLVLVRNINLKRAREVVSFLTSDVIFYALHLLMRIYLILLGSFISDWPFGLLLLVVFAL